jgi:hypothetical protein
LCRPGAPEAAERAGYDRLVPTAHYDGVAAWYDEHLAPGPEMTDVARLLVGPGPGSCLDLGCGSPQWLALRASR